MPVFALIPLACFASLTMLARRNLPKVGLPGDLASALVVAAIGMGVFVLLLTELVSLVGMLSVWPVLAAWLVFLVALLVVLRPGHSGGEHGAVASPDERVLPTITQWRTWGFWLWVGAGLVVLLALVVALASPPNTHDALAYHLPRQVRWMQMGAVRMYATDDMRELSFPPLAEYLQMHTMLLTSSDVLVHVPQWASYALTVLSAALLCRALGFVSAAPLGALLAACQPMAYIQAATPKNDPVLMFLVVAFAWLAAEALRSRRCGASQAAIMGAALGLAAVTKSTAAILLFPLCVLVGVTMLWQHRVGALWRGAIIVAVASMMLAGHTTRNVQAFGHPLGPLERADGGFSLSMERHDIEGVGSNLIRQLALHAVLDTKEQVAAVESTVRSLHERLGWNPDDPKTTWMAGYVGQVALDNEGRAPAPLHLVLALIAMAPLVWRSYRNFPHARLVLAFWLCAVLGLLFFVAMVKWNPWHARLHSPLIALLAAPTAIGLLPRASVLGRWIIALAAGIPVLAFVGWAAAINVDRPLLGPRGVLIHPGQPVLRWRSQAMFEQVQAAVEGLWRLPEGPVAILAADMDYTIMREVKNALGNRPFTSLNPNLGPTSKVDQEWQPPELFISAYHVMPVHVFGDRIYVRHGSASSLNLFARSDTFPVRSLGDPLPDLPRYHAVADPSTAGRMAPSHGGFVTAFGLALPTRGLEIAVPGDGTPRTLLMAFNPRAGRPMRVSVTLLGDGVLLDAPALERRTYTPFEVEVPGIDSPGTLRLRFIDEHGEDRPDAVSVGWIQLPTVAQVGAYDARTGASPPPHIDGKADHAPR